MSRRAETPIDDWDLIANAIREIKKRLDELERPTGTQRYRSVDTLKTLVENIQETLDSYIATRWTNAQIAAEIDSRVNAAIAAAFAGNVSITGSLTVNGALAAASLSTAGALTAGGKVTAPGIYGLNVVTAGRPRLAVWVDSAGEVGHT